MCVCAQGECAWVCVQGEGVVCIGRCGVCIGRGGVCIGRGCDMYVYGVQGEGVMLVHKERVDVRVCVREGVMCADTGEGGMCVCTG